MYQFLFRWRFITCQLSEVKRADFFHDLFPPGISCNKITFKVWMETLEIKAIYNNFIWSSFYMYIIAGKKSASWQLVAVVMGLKQWKVAKNYIKLLKSTETAKSKEKICLISKKNFLGWHRFWNFSHVSCMIYILNYLW